MALEGVDSPEPYVNMAPSSIVAPAHNMVPSPPMPMVLGNCPSSEEVSMPMVQKESNSYSGKLSNNKGLLLPSNAMDVVAGLRQPQDASMPMGGVNSVSTLDANTALNTSVGFVKLAYTLYEP